MHFKPSGCSVTLGKRYLLDTNALVALLQGHANSALMALIADIRKRKTVKLPDAIVAASAVLSQALLVTNDAQLLKLAAEDANYAALSF